MSTRLELSQMFRNAGQNLPDLGSWHVQSVLNDDNLGYLAWNRSTQEAIWVDPVREDLELMLSMTRALKNYRIVAVIDTHTHADHISGATDLARALRAPLIMHQMAAPSTVDFRVSRDATLATAAGGLRFIPTPGHTRDSMTVTWGPFIFAGDTLLYGDSGRDDLPTGDSATHYDSLELLKSQLTGHLIFLTNHDSEARACTWAFALENNVALKQSREDFIRESDAFRGPAPKRLKESLFENFK